jgi:hypothetical protein
MNRPSTKPTTPGTPASTAASPSREPVHGRFVRRFSRSGQGSACRSRVDHALRSSPYGRATAARSRGARRSIARGRLGPWRGPGPRPPCGGAWGRGRSDRRSHRPRTRGAAGRCGRRGRAAAEVPPPGPAWVRSAPPAAAPPPCAGASRWRPTLPDRSPTSPVGAGGSRRASRRARSRTARGRSCPPTTTASSRAPTSRPRAAPAAPWQGAVGARSGSASPPPGSRPRALAS